ncbi:MAG: hypothetical protein FJX35_15150 [Alphaproteobacteria bacterium]|nr:hypothetical protein [Alphaproteobacteria bacterium]
MALARIWHLPDRGGVGAEITEPIARDDGEIDHEDQEPTGAAHEPRSALHAILWAAARSSIGWFKMIREYVDTLASIADILSMSRLRSRHRPRLGATSPKSSLSGRERHKQEDKQRP